MTESISFPNLGIYFEHVGKSISVFGFPIAYYGMIIGCGIIFGTILSQHQAKRTGQDPEIYLDLIMIGSVLGILGARAYYVIFNYDLYRGNPMEILNIRNGGLAIYGGVITAVIVTYVFAKIRKQKFALLLDTVSAGLLLGQVIGRWGNFFNREAFGGYTDNLLAMRIPLDAVRSSDLTEELLAHVTKIDGISYIQVHPTFLYESLWNLGLLLIIYVYTRHKKFHGELFCMYMIGYGVGRFMIEGLRTDQLIFFGTGIPISQIVAILMIFIGGCIMVYNRRKSAPGSAAETAGEIKAETAPENSDAPIETSDETDELSN